MSFAATVLQNLRHSRINSGQRVDMHELRSRAGNVGFTRLFQADTPLLLGSEANPASMVSKIKNLSDDRTHQIVAMDNGTVNDKAGVRSCTITTQQNDSQLLAVTFTTIVYDFNMLPMQLWNGGAGNNEIAYAEDFEQKIVNIEDAAFAAVEASCIASALAYKTINTAYDAQTPYTIQVANEAMDVPLAEHFDFLNQIDPIVSLHKFGSGGLNIVASQMYQADVNRHAESGSLKVIDSNGVSDSAEAWQLQNKIFRYTDYLPAIAVPAVVKHRVFASKPATFGLVTQNPPAFRNGAVTGDGTKFEETGAMPISGFSYGHQKRVDCLNGKEVQEFHQLSLNYTTISAHNATAATEPSACFEANLLAV